MINKHDCMQNNAGTDCDCIFGLRLYAVLNLGGYAAYDFLGPVSVQTAELEGRGGCHSKLNALRHYSREFHGGNNGFDSGNWESRRAANHDEENFDELIYNPTCRGSLTEACTYKFVRANFCVE